MTREGSSWGSPGSLSSPAAFANEVRDKGVQEECREMRTNAERGRERDQRQGMTAISILLWPLLVAHHFLKPNRRESICIVIHASVRPTVSQCVQNIFCC
jgi:hypothetical protein